MTDILHEQHQGNNHFNVVRLASECAGWWSDSTELRMKQIPKGVKLVRFTEGQESQQFELSGDEIDALVEARAAFLADIRARELAEQKRIADEVVEAYRLVEMVCKDNNLQWKLTEDAGMYSLLDEQFSHCIMHNTRANYLLGSVKSLLVRKKLIAPEPAKDDAEFDPFLDESDLP